MKRAAAEEDIYYLFRIMLGRKPSPASYVQTNKGVPLSELIRRMAASDEFAEKVLKPLQAARQIADRPLRDEELRWLKAVAQLPERYATIIAQTPTQFRAALTLALRAFDGAGGRSAERRRAISEALSPLGIAKPDPAEKRQAPNNSSDPSVNAEDWRFLWALFGGHTQDEGASAPGRNARLSNLAQAILAQDLLCNRLVPALYGQTDLPGWTEIAEIDRRASIARICGAQDHLGDTCRLQIAWTALLYADKQRRLTQLLESLRLQDADCADAVDTLTKAAEVHWKTRTDLSQGKLPEALFRAQLAFSQGETYAAPLLRDVENAVTVAMEWPERLVLQHMVDRLANAGAEPVFNETALIEISPDEARNLGPGKPGARYLLRLTEHRLSDGVRALLGSALDRCPVLLVRLADPAQDMPSALLSFQPDPVGVVVRSASEVPDALSRLEAGALKAEFSIPALAAEPRKKPRADQAIVLSLGRLGHLPARTVALKPDQTISQALDAVSGPDDLPVLISHPDMPLTEAQLSVSLAHYERFGRPPILSLAGIEASLWHREIEVSALTGDTAQIASLAWLPMAVMSLKAARSLRLAPADALTSLIGVQGLMEAADAPGQVAFAASPELEMAAAAEKLLKPLLSDWTRGLKDHAPALAPNLPSCAALRRQALRGPAAQRLVSGQALDQAQAALAAVERLASGRLEQTEAQQIASPRTTDLLLSLGLHVPLGAALSKLIAAQEVGVFADELSLRWALKTATLAGLEASLASALTRAAPAIIEAYPDLLRPLFELAASTLPADRIAILLTQCIARSSASDTARFCHRVAEISRLYLDSPGARLVYAALGQISHSQSVQAAFAVALGRDGSGAEMDLPVAEALRLAISRRDISAFAAATRAFFETEDSLIDYLDPLRAFARELAEMDIPETALPYHRCADDREVALMALIFGARERLEELHAGGSSEIDAETSAMIAAALGDRNGFLKFLCGIGSSNCRLAAPDCADERWAFEAFANAPLLGIEPVPGRVSVVMSSLETETPLLEAAIGSILAQSHTDLELLLIDDGSNGAAREALLAQSTKDPRIRTYCMPKNLGPYLCRNFALSIATGAFLAIQDADDIAHPDRLALQMQAMRQDPRRQLVTSHHIRIDPRGWPQLEHRFRLLGDGTMTSLFRREALDKLGPFLPVRSRGDVEMRERIRKWYGSEAIHRIDFPLVACHASPQTLSQRTVAAKGNFLQLFRKGIDAIRPHPDLIGSEAPVGISIPAPLEA